MEPEKVKGWLIKATGIWFLLAGTALTLLGIFCFVVGAIGCSQNDISGLGIFVSPIIIPGVLFIFAGRSVLKADYWGLAFICSIILCIGLGIFLFGGGFSVLSCVLFCTSLIFAGILVFIKSEFF